jgi:hypothetical protein
LAQLPVRTDIKEALLARKGLYWQLLEIAIAHERADWEKVSALVTEIGMDEERVSSLYAPLSIGPRLCAATLLRLRPAEDSLVLEDKRPAG